MLRLVGGAPSSLIVPVIEPAVVAFTDFPAGALAAGASFVAVLFPQPISAAASTTVPTTSLEIEYFISNASFENLSRRFACHEARIFDAHG